MLSYWYSIENTIIQSHHLMKNRELGEIAPNLGTTPVPKIDKVIVRILMETV